MIILQSMKLPESKRTMPMKILVAQKILKANDGIAAENRRQARCRRRFGLNIVVSPAREKPRSWNAVLRGCKGRLAGPAVLEGDIAGWIDAETDGRSACPSSRSTRPAQAISTPT